MSAQTVASTIGVLWTPPFTQLNSGNSAINLSAQYNAQNVGELDIPGATAAATPFTIPFGSVQSAKFFMIKNNLSFDIGIKLNGASSVEYQIAPGGLVLISQPQGPNAVPLATAIVVTTAIQGSTETISFWIFGD